MSYWNEARAHLDKVADGKMPPLADGLYDLTGRWGEEEDDRSDISSDSNKPYECCNFHDLDIGQFVAVGGRMHNGQEGIVLMCRTSTGWTQRGRLTTHHLNNDYVSGERLDDILERWVPVDFVTADAVRVRAEQVAELWTPQLDGEPFSGFGHIE